jgi:hypothetical protein
MAGEWQTVDDGCKVMRRVLALLIGCLALGSCTSQGLDAFFGIRGPASSPELIARFCDPGGGVADVELADYVDGKPLYWKIRNVSQGTYLDPNTQVIEIGSENEGYETVRPFRGFPSGKKQLTLSSALGHPKVEFEPSDLQTGRVVTGPSDFVDEEEFLSVEYLENACGIKTIPILGFKTDNFVEWYGGIILLIPVLIALSVVVVLLLAVGVLAVVSKLRQVAD